MESVTDITELVNVMEIDGILVLRILLGVGIRIKESGSSQRWNAHLSYLSSLGKGFALCNCVTIVILVTVIVATIVLLSQKIF